jgi:hypothetical protein
MFLNNLFRLFFSKKVDIFFGERPTVADMHEFLVQINSPFIKKFNEATKHLEMNEDAQVQYMRGVPEQDAAMVMLKFGGHILD